MRLLTSVSAWALFLMKSRILRYLSIFSRRFDDYRIIEGAFNLCELLRQFAFVHSCSHFSFKFYRYVQRRYRKAGVISGIKIDEESIYVFYDSIHLTVHLITHCICAFMTLRVA